MGMVRIEADEHSCCAANFRLYLSHDFWCGGRSLDHMDPARHRMRLDRRPVVRTDIDVDTHDKTLRAARIHELAQFDRIAVVQQRQHRSAEDQRSAVSDAGFYDHIRSDLPDQFLHRHNVLRILDDRAAKRGEMV